MTTVHRTVTGAWGRCLRPETCTEMFHLPDTTVKQANRLPLSLLAPLFEAVLPPTRVIDGFKLWENSRGQMHRDYDLPASIGPAGQQLWYQHDRLHRASDRPALITAEGHMEWAVQGSRHRASDKPAVLWADGRQDWYHRGLLHRANGPAVINPDGTVEYWLHGKRVG